MSNNNCRSIQELLSAYLDHELPPTPRQAVAAHLAHCPACCAELRQLQQLQAALPAWNTPAVDPQLSVRFAERLAQRQQTPARRLRGFPALQRLAWAGLAIATVWGMVYYGSGPSHRQTTSGSRPHSNQAVATTDSTPRADRLAPLLAPPQSSRNVHNAGPHAARRIPTDRRMIHRHMPPVVVVARTPSATLPVATDEGAAVVALITEAPHASDACPPANNAITVTASTTDDPVLAVVACLTETE